MWLLLLVHAIFASTYTLGKAGLLYVQPVVDPLYVALYGYFFLGESITSYFLISVLLVFIGLFVFYREELKEGYHAS